MEAPQPSPMVPQKRAPGESQDAGMQPFFTHSPPALHDSPAAHDPQSSVPPQPSPTVPQYLPPVGVQVAFTQPGPAPHTLRTAPPHTPPFAQTPQSSVPPQPSPITPQNVAPWVMH